MTAKEFDKKFDDNEEDIIQYFDLPKTRRAIWVVKRLQSLNYQLATVN